MNNQGNSLVCLRKPCRWFCLKSQTKTLGILYNLALDYIMQAWMTKTDHWLRNSLETTKFRHTFVALKIDICHFLYWEKEIERYIYYNLPLIGYIIIFCRYWFVPAHWLGVWIFQLIWWLLRWYSCRCFLLYYLLAIILKLSFLVSIMWVFIYCIVNFLSFMDVLDAVSLLWIINYNWILIR